MLQCTASLRRVCQLCARELEANERTARGGCTKAAAECSARCAVHCRGRLCQGLLITHGAHAARVAVYKGISERF